MDKIRLLWMVFLGMLAALAPLATDMYLPALPVMTAAFGVRASTVQLSLTMTMIGMSDRSSRAPSATIGGESGRSASACFSSLSLLSAAS